TLAKLSAADARNEILARLGPPEGARWLLLRGGPGAPAGSVSLFVELASGIDDLVLLDLDDTQRVRGVRSLSDPAQPPKTAPPELDGAAQLAPAHARTAPGPRWPLPVGAIAVAAAAACCASRRPLMASAALAGSLPLLLGVLGCGARGHLGSGAGARAADAL